MTSMKVGQASFSPYNPDVIATIGDKSESEYPYGFQLNADEITFDQWVDGFDFHKVTDPKNDGEADAHLERVYSVRVDKSEVGDIAKYPNIVRVEYTEGGSTVLPNEIADLESVRFLTFEMTKKYKKLPKALAKMKQLEALTITNVALKDISLLSELPNLKYLSLYGVAVEDFSVLAELEQLEELQLQSFWWDELPAVLAEIPSLKRLHLGGSVREDVDLSVLTNIPRLEELFLEWADLPETPAEFAEMGNLKKLKLNHCEFETFDSIAGLKGLEVLDTYGFDFAAVPAAFGKLSNLRYLSLAANDELKEISAITALDLQFLDLSGTALESVDLNMSSLKELSLDSCDALKDVSGLEALSDLEVLDLSFSKLTEYPKAVQKLTNLRVLDINSAKFPLEPLGEHPSLQFVYLGWTKPEEEITGTQYIEEQSGILYDR